MHVSELSRKFQQFVGKSFHLKDNNSMDGEAKNAELGDNTPPSSPDENCPHTRRLFRQLTEMAHKFNAEVIVNDAEAKTRALCHVHVNVGDDSRLIGNSSILGIEARINAPI